MEKKPITNAPEDHQHITTNQGVKVAHNDDTLKAGIRGATLIEDFISGKR